MAPQKRHDASAWLLWSGSRAVVLCVVALVVMGAATPQLTAAAAVSGSASKRAPLVDGSTAAVAAGVVVDASTSASVLTDGTSTVATGTLDVESDDVFAQLQRRRGGDVAGGDVITSADGDGDEEASSLPAVVVVDVVSESNNDLLWQDEASAEADADAELELELVWGGEEDGLESVVDSSTGVAAEVDDPFAQLVTLSSSAGPEGFPPTLVISTLDGSPLLSSFQRLVPSVGGGDADVDRGEGVDNTEDDDDTAFDGGGAETDVDSDADSDDRADTKRPQSILIPARDGSIIFYGTHGMQQLPHDAARLADACPVTTDTMHFVGGKESHLFGLDARTGEMRRSYRSSRGTCSYGAAETGVERPEPLLWVGRRDNYVQAFDAKTGLLQWNFSFSTVLRPSFSFATASDDSEQGGVPSHDMQTQALLRDLSLSTTVDGTVYGHLRSSSTKWTAPLTAHVSTVHLVTRPGDPPTRVEFVDLPTEPSRGASGADANGGGGEGTAMVPADGARGYMSASQGQDIVVAALPNGQLYAYPKHRPQPSPSAVVTPGRLPTRSTTFEVPTPTPPLLIGSNGGGVVPAVDALPAPPSRNGQPQQQRQPDDQPRRPTWSASTPTGGPVCDIDSPTFRQCILGAHNLSRVGATTYVGSESGTGPGELLSALAAQITAAADDDSNDDMLQDGWILRWKPDGTLLLSHDGVDALSVHWSMQSATVFLLVSIVVPVLVATFIVPRFPPANASFVHYAAIVALLIVCLPLLDLSTRQGVGILFGFAAGVVVAFARPLPQPRTQRPPQQQHQAGPEAATAGDAEAGAVPPAPPMLLQDSSSAAAASVEPERRVIAGQPHTMVGSIAVSDKVLGHGSNGTVVLAGFLGHRPVAVKRVVRQYCHVASREVSLLINLDDHANVVRFFAHEETTDFVYLALERCSKSLFDAVQKASSARERQLRALHKTRRGGGTGTGNGSGGVGDVGGNDTDASLSLSQLRVEVPPPSNATRRFLKELVIGVEHIHLHKIVHRDLKPHNFLLLPLREKKARRVVQRAEDDAAGESAGTGAGAGAGGDAGAGGGTSRGRSRQGKRSAVATTPVSPAERALERQEFHKLGLAWRPKVSDMGLAKQLRASASSFGGLSLGQARGSSSSGRLPGSVGWQAPEVLQALAAHTRGAVFVAPDSATAALLGVSHLDENGHSSGDSMLSGSTDSAVVRKTRAVDIWSLGCVLYYVLDVGNHPYGPFYERQGNIIRGKFSLSRLDHIPDAKDVIASMIRSDPTQRPSAAEVLEHPFFWTDKQRMDFLQELSDLLEREGEDSRVLAALESRAKRVVGNGWNKKLPRELIEEMETYRTYNYSGLQDLLRLVRNKRHHYAKLPKKLQDQMGFSPTSFVRFFTSRFPRLLMACHRVACTHLAHDTAVATLLGPITTARHRPAAAAAAAAEAARIAARAAKARAVASAKATGATTAVTRAAAGKMARVYYLGEEAWATTDVERTVKKEEEPTRFVGGNHSADARYKTKLCKDFEATQHCGRGWRCDFAHGPWQLREPRRRLATIAQRRRHRSNRHGGDGAGAGAGGGAGAATSPGFAAASNRSARSTQSEGGGRRRGRGSRGSRGSRGRKKTGDMAEALATTRSEPSSRSSAAPRQPIDATPPRPSPWKTAV